MIHYKPEYVKFIDDKTLLEFAGYDEQEEWIVAPALAIIGISSDAKSFEVDKLASKDTFTTERAIMLMLLSENLRVKPKRELVDRIPKDHPILKLESAKNNDERMKILKELSDWVKSLLPDDTLYGYLPWAVEQLNSNIKGSKELVKLPDSFGIDI